MSRTGRTHGLEREDRIRRKADFDEAYADGVRISSKSFMLIARPAGRGHPRLGLTLPRSVGNAVVRNAVRRRVREAFRRNRNAGWPAVDMIIHVRATAAAARYADIEAELMQAIRRYADRQGRSS